MPNQKRLNLLPIGCVSTLRCNIKKIEDDQEWRTGQQPLQYYRGLSKASHKLQPSVMRDTKHYENEGVMLRDLITRQPDEFAKFPSALDQWMLAQHHGLCTRFLDITANPLVGLYFACNKSQDTDDGLLYVFATTRDRVKPYDSDAVSIIANFARLRRCEQEEIRRETEKFLVCRDAFIPSQYHIMRTLNGKDVNDEVSLYDGHMNRSPTRAYMGRLQTFIRQEKPYFVEGLIDPRDLFRIFIVQPRRLFPRVRAQSGAFLVSAHHETFDFDRKVRYDKYRAKDGHDVPYNFYRLTVEAGRKRCILKELESLNISEETLFPELEKSAKAIVKENESKEDRQKLTVTFEPSKSGERPAVVRYRDHCLKIYRDRIVYRGKTKYWKVIMKEETVKACALVPLTSNEDKLRPFDDKISSDFYRGDNVHFEIEYPGSSDRKGHFYVSSSGVAWVGKNGKDPKIREIKSWAEFHKWMTSEQPDEPGR